ncbi:hypothetical protein [Dinoroseobacter sp. S375]|uniref:hypothetical protein n=1 Tax=Dinoroseobacter sp. S375 TaxID=3415136 RepID=UPI003C7AD836
MTYFQTSQGRLGALCALLLVGWLVPAPLVAQTEPQLRLEQGAERPRLSGPQSFGTQERRQRAVMDLDCGNKTYRLDTGNDTGSCGAYTNEAGVVVVTCTDGTEILVEANCAGGCVQASGTGSCTINP